MSKKRLFLAVLMTFSTALCGEDCYCKLCGNKFASLRQMMNFKCPNTERGQGVHELFQGDTDSPRFICIYCGLECNSLRTLVNLTRDCPKHRGYRHEPYEGTLKSRYTCIKCGQSFPAIRTMVNLQCPKKGGKTTYHEPCR